MGIFCRIRTDSHTLSSESFRLFQLDASNIRIHGVRGHDFVISVRQNLTFEQTLELLRQESGCDVIQVEGKLIINRWG